MRGLLALALASAWALIPQPAAAAPASRVHGMWIWKSSSLLQSGAAARSIVSFCQTNDINEVYVSVGKQYSALQELQLLQLITLLHAASVRVEALISSTDGDQVGAPRTKLLDHVQLILQFDRHHPAQRFDGIHLDIEPQQRPENKGPENLDYLPGLIDSYRAVRTLTDRAGLTLDADIQSKILKADLELRRALLSAVPRLTLMMYELNRPDDGSTMVQKIAKVRDSSRKYLAMTYQGLDTAGLARLSIALRTADYGPVLPQMLAALDDVNRADPHYLGWARHSYNDTRDPLNGG